MSKKTMITIAFLLAIAAAYFLLYGRRYESWTSEGSDDQKPPFPPPPDTDSSGKMVSIKNSVFAPSPFTVAPGTTVTWKNEDSMIHQVGSGDFVSPPLAQGEIFSYTFFEPGVYDYFCPIHPFMKGAIVVE